VKYAILGDLHGCVINLKRIQKKLKQCDVIFITGDITGTISYPLVIKSILKTRKISREKYTELVYTKYLEKFTKFQINTAKKIFKILGRLNKPVFFTHGNSDTDKARDFFEEVSNDNPNLFYVGNRIKIFEKLEVIGYGFCSPAKYRTSLQTPGEKEEVDIKSDLKMLEQLFHSIPTSDDKIIIGLFHEPPKDTKLDYIPKKATHGGSNLIREHISKIPYSYSFAGHIHESQNQDKIGSIIAINPGALVDRKYTILNLEDNDISFERLFLPLSLKELIYRTRDVFK